MNYPLQLSLISGTYASVPSGEQWDTPSTNWEDVKFFRSWLVYESDPEANHSQRINPVLGLALAVFVSATFWAGLGFTIAHFWQ